MVLIVLYFLVFTTCTNGFLSRFSRMSRVARISSKNYIYDDSPVLYPTRTQAIETFYDKSDPTKSGLECSLLYNARIDNVSYSIGFPVDTPVALCYFERSELKHLDSTFPDYNKLFEYIGDQLKCNDLELANTAMVMTIQGEFDDEELNDIYPITAVKTEYVPASEYVPARQLYGREYQDLMFSPELDDDNEELNHLPKGKHHRDIDDDDDLADDMPEIGDTDTAANEDNESSDESESREPDPTPEEARELRLKHKVAERVMDHAADLKLMGTFFFRQRVFHLVQLLEPIIVVGKLVDGSIELLDAEESQRVQPILDGLVQNLKQMDAVDGVHAKSFPKYSKRSMMDQSAAAGGNGGSAGTIRDTGRDKGSNKKSFKKISPFEQAQRDWYTQKAATNKRPGLGGYGGGGGGSADSRRGGVGRRRGGGVGGRATEGDNDYYQHETEESFRGPDQGMDRYDEGMW